MSRMSDFFDRQTIWRQDLELAGAVYVSQKNCYRFPDGSLGRLIAFRDRGSQSDFYQLVSLRTVE